MGSSKLKARVKALESLTKDSTWLILDCKIEPTQEQLQQMEQAYNQGRMAICFIETGNTIWIYGYPKPWLNECN